MRHHGCRRLSAPTVHRLLRSGPMAKYARIAEASSNRTPAVADRRRCTAARRVGGWPSPICVDARNAFEVLDGEVIAYWSDAAPASATSARSMSDPSRRRPTCSTSYSSSAPRSLPTMNGWWPSTRARWSRSPTGGEMTDSVIFAVRDRGRQAVASGASVKCGAAIARAELPPGTRSRAAALRCVVADPSRRVGQDDAGAAWACVGVETLNTYEHLMAGCR